MSIDVTSAEATIRRQSFDGRPWASVSRGTSRVAGVTESFGRITDLCARFGLPPASARVYERLLQLVADEPMALTSVREPAAMVDLHLADSLAGLELAQVRKAVDLADLGSGAGFPGLILAVALPDARVILVESVGKKAAFLERSAAELGLTNVDVVGLRVEEWADGRGSVGLVTARALAPLAVLLEYAAPLLRPDGALVAWKGRRDPAEERAAEAAAGVVGMGAPGCERVPGDIVTGADERHLYVSLKVGSTPQDFPRRPGMARKRPLGASS
jgi:16S rRNA (guanine527-N7)-methyltransferase